MAATEAFAKALERAGLDYEVDEGGAAFYGPKIDLKMIDALGREWQLCTIQFDFNMSARFELDYAAEDGTPHRPYMVHRALMGTMERFLGVLIEHYAGAFPVWLAPVQAMLIPIATGIWNMPTRWQTNLRMPASASEWMNAANA